MATVSARVYVWYPHPGGVGHASMHIGPDAERDGTVNYVSWWPAGEARARDLAPGRMFSSYVCTMNEDAENEGGRPHVSFMLYDLDVPAMSREWSLTKGKHGSHYRAMRKNCSTIVARVLRAGGASTWAAKGFLPSWDAHRAWWTPKLVAQFCAGICHNGHGQAFDHNRTDAVQSWTNRFARMV